MKKDDIYYQALLARDNRFDGKFFVAVKTTGIYCRPICPARPKRENVTFFPSAYAAEKAGYRPCLRCRPEAAPQSPAWLGKSAVVRRALKMINNNETIEFDEDHFAEMFGVTARHLRRLFMEEVGKTPKQLAFENRLNLARKLIVETALPITEIAFAAGFKSIRRFNESFLDRFKKNPSSIRRQRLPNDAPLIISLSYRPPFDFKGLLRFFASHHMGDLEKFEDDKMLRYISINGKQGKIIISNDEDKNKLLVEIDFPDISAIHAIIARVRRVFDLDSDPILIANAFEVDKPLAKLFKKHKGIRLPTGWDPFETAIATILGQLVSVPQGRKFVAQLIDEYGEEVMIDGKAVKLFPSPEKIASADLLNVKTTNARREALKTFARAIVDGTISLEPTQNMEEFIKQVCKLKGIGRWTADYMAMRVLGDTDAFPATDLILARALEFHPKEIIERISPWRAYAAALLWREYADKLKKTRSKNHD